MAIFHMLETCVIRVLHVRLTECFCREKFESEKEGRPVFLGNVKWRNATIE